MQGTKDRAFGGVPVGPAANFGNGKDGANPIGDMVFEAAANLYGTTSYGGAYTSGTVFEITP
jgi:hypothetical protein